jgi:hypothetical protein
MTESNHYTFEQVYNVEEDESLSSRVAFVICALAQRGLMVAGFGTAKELLTIHYTGYNKDKPVWSLDFFEHILVQEPLLTMREKVKGIFILSDKNLVVPDALYDEREAKKWLGSIHFIESRDGIEIYSLETDKANYLQAVPRSITELLKINFRKVPVMALPVYQFIEEKQQSLYLQCCLTSEQACVTLHNYSQLLWHKVFSYVTAEDIAYEIKHFCIEGNISPSKVTLLCNTFSAGEQAQLNELSQYFSGMKCGNGSSITNPWDAAISLSNQLFLCV